MRGLRKITRRERGSGMWASAGGEAWWRGVAHAPWWCRVEVSLLMVARVVASCRVWSEQASEIERKF